MRFLKLCLAYSFLLATATSCRRKTQPRVTPKHAREAAAIPQLVDEACLIDISLPWGVQAYDISTQERPNSTVIQYQSSLTLTALYEFYMLDMERHGWLCIQNLPAQTERLLLFEKPLRCCILHMIEQPHNNAISVTLFIYPRATEELHLAESMSCAS